ncbi:heat shock protein 70 homolog Lhs1p [Trichomonascus vanleenenianus]|uniref:Hsp70 family chaperone LHS1 n=1 Tax=Trichomonascus vanleenenianus TaxID=2268995 RepID=UPI003ECAC27F
MRIANILLAVIACLASNVLAAVLGIDFGQEYTKASLVAPGAPFEVVLTADSKRKDISGLTYKKYDNEIERVFGNAASGLLARLPESSLFYYKPLLGKSLDDPEVQAYAQRLPGPVLVPSNNNRSTVAYSVFGQTYPVEEILAMSLSDIKSRAAALLESTSGSGYVKDTAVTVPLHYTTEQRRAIADAVEISGLKLISLVNDGVAVAVNFASGRQFGDEKQYHVIYDAGAGSTTATLVSIRQGDVDGRPATVIEVEGVGYDAELGGQLMTERLRGLLIDKFLEAHPRIEKSALTGDARVMNKLWSQADRVKTVLSANTETSAYVESLFEDSDFSTKVSRSEFEALNEDLKLRSTAPIDQALNNPLNPEFKGKFDIFQVESVILTGGSVRVPFLQQELQKLVGESVSLAKNVNADEAAVLGATLRGVGISKVFKAKEVSVVDRAIWDYQYELAGSEGTLFSRGSPLGSKVSIPLGELDEFAISVKEDGRQVNVFHGSKVQETVASMKKDAKRQCVGDVIVEAEFELTHSRTVELVDVVAFCMAQEKEKKTKTKVETESVSATETGETGAAETTETTEAVLDESASSTSTPVATETESTAPLKPMRRYISTKTKYGEGRPRPMGSASKRSASGRVRQLDIQDESRRLVEEARNTLEGKIYRAKDMLSDLPEEDQGDALSKLEEEFSDWLDFEGQKASYKAVMGKIKDLDVFTKSYVSPASTPATEPVPPTPSSSEAAPSEATTSETPSSEATADTGNEKIDAIKNKYQDGIPPSPLGDMLREMMSSVQQVVKTIEGLGLDPTKDYPELGLDLKNLDNYVREGLEEEESSKKQLQETIKLIKESLRQASSPDVTEEEKARLEKMIEERDVEVQRQQEIQKRNQEKRIKALNDMVADASKSLDVMERQKESQATATTIPAGHDDL